MTSTILLLPSTTGRAGLLNGWCASRCLAPSQVLGVLKHCPLTRPAISQVRKLLDYPTRPAVVMLHTWVWHETSPKPGTFWGNAERDLSEIGLYYRLPAVSVKVSRAPSSLPLHNPPPYTLLLGKEEHSPPLLSDDLCDQVCAPGPRSPQGCCYHLMQRNVTGFRVDIARRTAENMEALKWQTFYGDAVHGAGDTGYRVMSELLIHLFMKAMR